MHYKPLGGLAENSVARITDHPDMILAVDIGCKSPFQTRDHCGIVVERRN